MIRLKNRRNKRPICVSSLRLFIAGCVAWLWTFPCAAQEIAGSPPAVAVNAQPLNQDTPLIKQGGNAPTVEKAVTIKSLFFSSAETNEIHLAITSYLKNISGHEGELTSDEEDFLNQLTGLKKNKDRETAQQAPRSFTYPQFFMDSLVYHKPDDWVVWINGRQITPTSTHDPDNIRITQIDNAKVEIEWKPVMMDKVKAVWDKGQSPGIEVDEKYGTVTFGLRTNQTFTSYAMRVVEGKVPQVTVENVPGGAIISNSATAKNVKSAAIAKTKDKPKAAAQGLSGLLDAYDHMGDDKQ